ncbi:MAG: hypothetical protein ACJAT4_003369 [Granulosicoccus sp.]|jgi:hypothetical protein
MSAKIKTLLKKEVFLGMDIIFAVNYFEIF